jgi:hypothetical protein
MALTQVDQGLLGTYAQYTGFKNRIINGAMVVNQRATTITANNSGWQYTVDRFAVYGSATKFTAAQSSTAPSGFNNSLVLTSNSAYSIGSTDEFLLKQPIEGFNTADLSWGSASAKTITLSFWVQSSLTGLFSGNLRNASNDRCYVFSYTITSANTWQQITLTIPGDTSGTWAKDNSVGISIWWTIGSGSTYLGTAGSWGSTPYDGATGTTSLVGTNGATFYITGVQLEKGSTATSFDYRPYGTELALCQRYFYTCCLFNYGTNGYYQGYYGGSNALWNIRYPVQMRTTPTATISQPTQVQYYNQSGVWTNTTIQLASYNAGPNYNAGMTDLSVYVASDSSGGGKLIYLTGGATTTLPTIAISAEL